MRTVSRFVAAFGLALLGAAAFADTARFSGGRKSPCRQLRLGVGRRRQDPCRLFRERSNVRTPLDHTDFASPQGILVSTFTVPTDKMTDPAVKAFLRGQMEKLLASVRYSGT